jgi:Flp pilus assembly pilin Flp
MISQSSGRKLGESQQIRENSEAHGGAAMELVQRLWRSEEGQDIAEYAVMLAVILVIVVGTVRLIGSNANTVFSTVASSIQ